MAAPKRLLSSFEARRMRVLSYFGAAVLSVSLCTGAGLPRSTPEEQGVSSQGILSFVETADKDLDSLHSVMIVRHGKVIAEGWWAPYEPQAYHELYSLSKSVTSTAVGFAIAEGKLSLDDPVLKFFPDQAPANPSENLKSMRVSDLLRMSTGHQTEPQRTPTQAWTKTFLAHPVPFKPGTHFLYNTSGTYMLSAIVQKVTGQTVLDYLKPRLFVPLGVERPTWEASPQFISAGGYGLSIRTEDIAKFGQLYLQKGKWEGQQIVPAAWIEAATARQTSNGSNPTSDWDQGYGYQFWRARHGAYRGDGAFGQYCVVLPEQDAVIAITSGIGNMQSVLSVVWDKLLPAMKSESLTPDQDSQAKLKQALKNLSIRTVKNGGFPAEVTGKTFLFPKNSQKIESVTVKPDGNGGATLVARYDGKDQTIACAPGAWRKVDRLTLSPAPSRPAAVTGAWTEDNTLTVKVCFYETPFITTLALKFSGDEVKLNTASNVGFGSTRRAELVGSTKPPEDEPKKDAGTQQPAASAPVPIAFAPAATAPVPIASAPTAAPAPAASTPAPQGFARWEKEIAAYEAADRENPPAKGGSLFIGSSTIRLWKTLAQDFPRHKVINRGFGGSEIADSTHFADRIIFPYQPRQIFLRAGGNDIHAGKLPEHVAYDFTDFVNTVHTRLPKTEIVYIAVSPAPSRWGENDKYRALNKMIREQAIHMSFVTYIDSYDVSLTADGKPRPELFVDDLLHFNPDGYKLLTERVRPYLVPTRR